jgi:hypothetical protein
MDRGYSRGRSTDGVELPDMSDTMAYSLTPPPYKVARKTGEYELSGSIAGSNPGASGLGGRTRKPLGMTAEQRQSRKSWRSERRWRLSGWADENEDQIHQDVDRHSMRWFVSCCPGDNCCPSPARMGQLYWRNFVNYLNKLQYCGTNAQLQSPSTNSQAHNSHPRLNTLSTHALTIVFGRGEERERLKAYA